jgi:hypothetical protein
MTNSSVLTVDRLSELETRIEQQMGVGQKAYAEIGSALAEIKESALWQERYSSFDEYCANTWNFESKRAKQLIGFGRFAKGLPNSKNGTTVPIPISERHYRPLAKLPESVQVDLYVKAVESLPEGEKISEKYMVKKVQEYYDASIKKLIANPPGGGASGDTKGLVDALETGTTVPPIATTIEDEDDTQDTELVEGIATIDADVVAKKAHGILSKINALPTGKAFDFAMLQAKNLKEKTYVALDGLARQVKEGGRVVIFCDPIAAYQIVQEAGDFSLVLEHSIVRPVEIDPEFKNNYLFPVGHEVVLVLLHGNESKDQRLNVNGVKAVVDFHGVVPGTYLPHRTVEIAELMLRAYCKAGDRVLCPTAGKHLINAAIAFGDLDVTYLTADAEKFTWYQEQFGV